MKNGSNGINMMIVIIVVNLFLFSIVPPRTLAQLSETSLEVAEKAASWIMNEAIPESGGYKWEFDSYWNNTFYESNMQWGSAGFGKFFLALYKATGNFTYLDYAKGSARWLIGQAISDGGGYKWAHQDDDIPSPGWWLSTSVAGIGEFLLALFQTTNDSLYLNYAKGAAVWLMAMAYWGDGTGECFIPYNPPGPYGSQAAHGIAPGREAYTVIFLLHMYLQTEDSVYLPYIEGMANWLMLGPDKVYENGGYKWSHNRPYGVGYPIANNGYIAIFFYETYQTLSKTEYLEHANRAMTWLLSQAVVNGDTAKWPEMQGSGRYAILPFSEPYQMGGLGEKPRICDLLMIAYEVTGNTTYLEYAKKLANWIISPTIATPEGRGYKFSYYEGTADYSASHNAQIYNFLGWMYNSTANSSYLKFANGALNWIVQQAEETDGGYRWKTQAYPPYYTTWFSGGAAGIGYYLTNASRLIPEFPSTTLFGALIIILLYATIAYVSRRPIVRRALSRKNPNQQARRNMMRYARL